MSHAYCNRADYFDFDVHPDPGGAFDMECALYHALEDRITNISHPASPPYDGLQCFICGLVRQSHYFNMQ
jgi:hypothetical protein